MQKVLYPKIKNQFSKYQRVWLNKIINNSKTDNITYQFLSMQSRSFGKNSQVTQGQLWKKSDQRAQKNGAHSNIYWVRKQPLNEDGSEKSNKWIGSNKYVGQWKDNKKHGFGIQYFENGNKYEGGWSENKRHGQGTFWVCDTKSKLRRQYTGDWENDQKKGRGTMFFKEGDRYDGMWMDNKPHGEGRMIYANGDVYEGMWFMGKRSGYGVMTKRCGDHFEGHWVNDMREGQGSYFFAERNKIFVGEWVADNPKAGVYSQVQDPTSIKVQREKHFTDPYVLPSFEQIGLANPTQVLEESIERVRKNRTVYRAKHIPLDELYTRSQLMELEKQYGVAVNQADTISALSMEAIMGNLGIAIEKEELEMRLRQIRGDYKQDQIDFEHFVRVVALMLELRNLESSPQHQHEEDEEEEKNWFNQEQKQQK